MSSRRGEFELIAALRERLAAAGATTGAGVVVGSGDDAAITTSRGVAVTSVDALVEGVHFRMPPFVPRQVGHKALAAALSDLAAMGAEPGEAYVQLGVPDALDDEPLLELADGLGAVAAAAGVAVVGGDITAAPVLFVAVTAVGSAPDPDAPVRRSGARPGDVLAHTGELGGAAAGLLLLDRPDLGRELPAAVAAELRRRQLEPQARLAAGRALREAGVRAMIDVSDGIAGDAWHLAAAGEVAITIDPARLRLAEGVREVASAAGRDALELALGGGEDYELLVALSPAGLERARERLDRLGVELTEVGSVAAGAGVEITGFARPASAGLGYDQRRR